MYVYMYARVPDLHQHVRVKICQHVGQMPRLPPPLLSYAPRLRLRPQTISGGFRKLVQLN